MVVIGTGGVGAAVASVASRRDFFDRMTLADLDPARAEAAVGALDDGRFAAAQVDAADKDALVALLTESGADAV